MLKFLVFENGATTTDLPIRNAYLVGSDNSGLRGEITFENGMIVCERREGGPAALALQQPAGDCGELTLQTCILPDRDEPYLLSLELARHRVMLLYQKLEDWGMFDLDDGHPIAQQVDLARGQFIEALSYQGDQPEKADRLARDCLSTAIGGSEEIARTHAHLLLNRRIETGAVPRHAIGCGVGLDQMSDGIRDRLASDFDFLYLSTPWRDLVPQEGDYRWEKMDNWCKWASQNRLPIVAGPIVQFEPSFLPDWIYIWEHDYETLHDLVYEHTERLVTRYRKVIGGWNVVSGLNVNGHFTLSCDQLVDLSRMTTMLVRKIQRQARVLVEIRQPFGEYYTANPNSIPPLLYADLLIQGGTQFDGFSISFPMGQPVSGQYVRDVMQLSNLMDQFSTFGKPIHLMISAPSASVTASTVTTPASTDPIDSNCGYWREPWSQSVQSRWLESLFQIAMSKPYVDSVAWQEIADHAKTQPPLAGLVGEDLLPKQAYDTLVSLRRDVTGRGDEDDSGYRDESRI